LIRIDEDGSYEYDDETGQTFDVDETWLACSACDKQLSDDEVEAD
jgi:hypothetical protein